jgi:type II secretory pathway pseudopilin PulG
LVTWLAARPLQHWQIMIRRRRVQSGYIYVEYLVVLILVGLVITLALFELGPSIVKNYTAQKTVLLEEGP